MKNLDWFITECYYESEAENSFIQNMMAEGLMSEYGDILTTEGHILQIKDWLDHLSNVDLTEEEYIYIREEALDLKAQYESGAFDE